MRSAVVSVPVTSNESIEIYSYEEFQVWLQAWDRTGGSSGEKELYQGAYEGVVFAVREAYAQRMAELDKMDAMFGEPEG